MKKRLTLFSLLLLFTMTAMARTLVDGIYYNLNGSDNTAEVTFGTDYRGDIVIPASISVDGVDYSVTLIGFGAFSCCYTLTSIKIPNSVTSIGENAFLGCYRLTSIDIPNSVTVIRGGAFMDCYRLTSIEIPNSVTSIESFAFSGCSSLTSIVVEEGNSCYDSRENCNAIYNRENETYNFSKRNVHFSFLFLIQEKRHLICILMMIKCLFVALMFYSDCQSVKSASPAFTRTLNVGIPS